MGASRQATIARRRAKAVHLREEGKTWQRIAEELGYGSPGAACQDVTRAREAALAEMREEVEAWRDREMARLDMLWEAAVEVLARHHLVISGGKVVRNGIPVIDEETGEPVIDDGAGEPLGDDGPAMDAIRTALRVEESRRKFLGLDAPQRVEASGSVHYTIEGVEPEALT